MNPELFGPEHIGYILITAVLGSAGLYSAAKFAKSERAQRMTLKALALLLFLSITANRLSQVFRYEDTRWYCIIPDSICGMTSLLLSLGVLFGKKDNGVLHFTWLLGLFGGIATVIYATFVGQGPTLFYPPTISGLLHHSFSATLSIGLLRFRYLDITCKKWYWTLIGFVVYIATGAFLMRTFSLSDAMHLAEPLLPGTPLTIWVMAPMYAAGYAIILLAIEKFKNRRKTHPPA